MVVPYTAISKKVVGKIDCKTVRIFAYSSTREQSNKRCGTRLKTESETGENATIPKGIVGSFEFNVLQRNLREWHERPWIYVCEC